MRIGVVGGGITGLACAQLLNDRHQVVLFEKEDKVGGLIRCERVNGSLFHTCGGHVFNTRNKRVLDWFWSKFDRDQDFVKAVRHSAVCMDDGRFVDYPIENHVYQLDRETQRGFIEDLKRMIKDPPREPGNFEEFLLNRFGQTLYDLYFQRYNAKVWRRNLSEVPLSWLEGKLPMPTIDEMLFANFNHIEETSFVHSSFYYEKRGGSQFVADTLAQGINVRCKSEILELRYGTDNRWLVNGETFDRIVFCGNIKDLPSMLRGVDLGDKAAEIDKLEFHGTTAVFCETDTTPYSWFYQPSSRHSSHRFICTGNFSPTNNADGKMTCTVEFTDAISTDDIKAQLKLMPYHPKYITHHYSKYTYPIQHHQTRDLIKDVKDSLGKQGLLLCGRFAEWEYHNMDAAIGSAMSVCDAI